MICESRRRIYCRGNWEIQKVSMKDDHTKMKLQRRDITGEQEIEGANHKYWMKKEMW